MTDTVAAEAAPVEAPVSDTAVETQAPENQAPITSAPESPQTAAPASPDLQTMLANPDTRRQVLEALAAQDELRKELYGHPAVRQDLEHRVNSETGRRFKTWQEQELSRLQQEQQARDFAAQRQRELEMDEYELGRARKEQLQSEQQMTAAMNALRPQLEQELRPQISVDAMGRFYAGILQGMEFSPEEMGKFHPQNFSGPEEQLRFMRDYVIQREAERRVEAAVKERVPKEVEAALAERLRQSRETERAPVGLPPGGAQNDDKAFLDDYAAGRSSDHTRAKRLLGL